MRSFVIYTASKYYSGNKIKKTEMVRECDTYGGQEMFIQGIRGESQWKETTWMTLVYYYSVVCLTTGPKPLPKRFLHIV